MTFTSDVGEQVRDIAEPGLSGANIATKGDCSRHHAANRLKVRSNEKATSSARSTEAIEQEEQIETGNAMWRKGNWWRKGGSLSTKTARVLETTEQLR
jgi:hypothetical protein